MFLIRIVSLMFFFIQFSGVRPFPVAAITFATASLATRFDASVDALASWTPSPAFTTMVLALFTSFLIVPAWKSYALGNEFPFAVTAL